jgi:hypothetical protein
MIHTDSGWEDEDAWWRANFASRPYAKGKLYNDFRPAYQYGYSSAVKHAGRRWDEVKEDLRSGWDKFEGKGPRGATWENIKDAVHDAWERIIGHHGLKAEKMSQSKR